MNAVRECLGWMEVNRRVLDQLCAGARVHLSPAFVVHAGWLLDRMTLTLVVSNIYRHPDGSAALQLSGFGDRVFLTVDADGRYLNDTGIGPKLRSDGARRVAAMRVPLFREGGQLFCPFCARPTVYRASAEYCSAHGGIPDPSSSLVISVETGWQTSWVMEGVLAMAWGMRTEDASRRAAADAAMKAKSPIEGDTCLSCGRGTYKWQSGTLICSNSACWHRPLVKS